MGTFDGPGLRMVVFLQGCNFKCLYCANPDTIPIGEGGKLVEDDEVLRRAINEKPFFGRRGGVTFSGGEPTVQAKDLIPVCRRLKEEGIHICLDSNGSIRNAYVEELWELVDMVLLDCKHINPHKHQLLVAANNLQTLRTAEYLRQIAKSVRLRYVLVPGYSDAEEDLHALGRTLGHYENIERIEILPYHTYGKHKYETIGQPYPLEHISEPSEDEVERARAIFEKYFAVVWTQ